MLRDERNHEEVRRLEDDFFDWFEAADAEELEDGTLDGFLEELERMDQLPGGFDPQKSLADFHEKYAALLGPRKAEKRQNRLPRRAFFAVAAAAAVLASMVTAQALGVDLFGFFGRWTDDTFTLTSSPGEAGYQRRFYPLEEGETAEYLSLDEALTEFQIGLPLVPRWLPERFGEFEVTASVTSMGMDIYAVSYGEMEGRRERLTVLYSEFGENGPALVTEKDENEPIIYESHGARHYIVTDNGHYAATWTLDNIQCVIRAPITIEEMERIIDSIYLDEETEASLPEGDQEMQFDSLEDALAAFEIDLPLVPRWFPERFGELEITGKMMPYGMRIFASSEGRENFLTVEYSEFGEDGPTVVIEKDKNDPIVYETNGMRHYIVTDHGDCKATWTVDNIQCIICAPVTVEEMERIMDSIYSEEKEAESPPSAGNQKMHFDALEDALAAFQFDPPLAPKWFPERFGELEVTGTIVPDHKSVYAWGETGQKDFLSLSYTKEGEGIPRTVIEKDGNPPVLYESGGVQHYLLTDHEWRTAVWIQGGIECIISGNITEEEMKQIIDSIYS